MEQRRLGSLFPVSALTLGGGGIGQVWGPTSRDEAIATVRAAYAGGITLFDLAPLYGRGEAETVMGLAFPQGYPDDLRVTTKCMLGSVRPEDVRPRIEASLMKSFDRMGRRVIDLFVLHGAVVPDGFSGGPRAGFLQRIAVPWTLYREIVVPTLRGLVEDGWIGAWGITAAGPLSTSLNTLRADLAGTLPDAVQCITNPLDSSGGMALSEESPNPRRVIAAAQEAGVGVMGIRAVAAGSLTDALDRDLDPASPEVRDFDRAQGFRELSAELGESPAALAHRYALTLPGVDTVVLGVKNRLELDECLEAEIAGPLDAELVRRIDASVRI